MKRTTIYLDSGLELRLKAEGLRRKQPMAELVREAVELYLTREPDGGPPGAGAFASGRLDTADRVDEVLAETGFGAPASAASALKRSATSRGKGRKTRRA
jgi:hypothetical protein